MDRKKVKLLVLLAVLAGVLAGAAALYARLSPEVDPGPALQETVTEETAQAQPETQTDAPDESLLAPDFTVYDGSGAAVRLSDLRGKPVIINFWASWCGNCKNGMPGFEDAYREYGEDIAFLMVNLTDGGRETVETASAFMAEAGYTFPVYYDTDYSAAIAYGVTSIPISFFIDAAGNGVAYAPGMLDRESLQIGIDLLLGEPTA